MPDQTKSKAVPDPEMPEWLLKVRAALEWISPQKADQALKNSPQDNRGLSPAVINRYTNSMNELRWIFSGESIIFDSGEPGKETLLDGWHRLNAIVESGKGQWMVVVRGVPRDAFHVIDHGRNRTFQSTLMVLRVPHSPFVSAAVGYVTGYQIHKRFSTASIEDYERWATFQQCGDKLGALQELYNKSLPLRGVAAPLLCAVHFVLAELEADQADEFMELVLHGDELEPSHPVAQFRALVKKINAMDKRPTRLPLKYGACLIKAWNLVRKGETVTKFVIPAVTPEPI